MGFQSRNSKISALRPLVVHVDPSDYYHLHGNLIHKTADIKWESIELGQGNKIGPFCVIGGMPSINTMPLQARSKLETIMFSIIASV